MSYLSVVLADTPVSVWMLGETSGTTAADSADSNPGTYQTGTTLNQASIIPTVTAGSLLATTGNNGVQVPYASNLAVNDIFSFEAWVQLQTGGTNTCILSLGGGGGFLRTNTDNTLHLLRSQVADMGNNPNALVLNTSYYVVATKNGSAMQIYINGVGGIGATSNSTCVSPNQVTSIAGWDDAFPTGWPGLVQGVALYNYALTPTQVTAHYTAGTVAPPAANYIYEIQQSLNVLAGGTATGPMMDDTLAANTWAGTTGLPLISALNHKNGTTGLDLNLVCNQLAGIPSGLADAQNALSKLAGGGYDPT